jgi:purine-binding chemotaxis protein CheW
MNESTSSKAGVSPSALLGNFLAEKNTHLGHKEMAHENSGNRHVGFRLENDEFLLDMRFVREIIMLPRITFLPRSDFAIEGVFAIRGEILPVVNLRRVLKMTDGCRDSSTRVIILQTERGRLGLIVDNITEFVWVNDSAVQMLDQNFFGERYHFLSGVSKIGTKMCGILDVEKLVARFPVVKTTPTDENET